MILENEEIKLRALELEDLDILYRWENDSILWMHGSTLSPYSKLALRQYINETQLYDIYQSKQLRLMVLLKESGTTIGTVDLYDFDIRNGKAGVGILIDETYRKKKYACQTLDILRNYAFSFLHLHQLYAYIAVSNNASLRLFEKAGYTNIGVLKDWIRREMKFEDVVMAQLINDEK